MRGFCTRRERADEVGPFERHVEEEPQRADGGVDGRRAELLLGHMQLIEAKVLARRGFRRSAEESLEVPDVPSVVPPGLHLKRRAVISSIMR